ncbi:DUF6538 domain-containing protein [Celeribacter litoreus]|uniref:DUF6538 domain-containing protein n=1 Tax=Celeribacter litoreus TaxID=2876714 RepID=UPI001CCA820D|nr:DUF6538 domain-containing protein [Celeribacter litoreus]MCA0044109.1 tyrosine-type recombinase/integrase [Celeribacter litoreus]
MPETISPSFTFVKAGVFYFSRRIPKSLQHHYTSPRIVHSLRTRCARIAKARARRAADQLDEYWYHLKSHDTQLPGQHMLSKVASLPRVDTPSPAHVASQSSSVTLSEAVDIYLRLKGNGKAKTFHTMARRSCGYVLDICGDKPLNTYTKKDANTFRDALLGRDLTGSTMSRIFGTVRAVTNFAASEMGLEFTNPFAKVYFDREAGVSKRQPVSQDALLKIAEGCLEHDDERRWLIALIADTGLRLAEATGILREDIKTDTDGAMHVVIQPHPWRSLKTKGSERIVPLEGQSRWAAERILAHASNSPFAFPSYNHGETTNANSASAALNKWIKTLTGETITMHGFRHALRDRLRAVECPSDIVDQIGGWQTDGVGQSYGSGYPLGVTRKWIKSIA